MNPHVAFGESEPKGPASFEALMNCGVLWIKGVKGSEHDNFLLSSKTTTGTSAMLGQRQ